jgi:hypothetical protein
MTPADPFFERLDSFLRERIPSEPVEVVGDWSAKTRKTYESEQQNGTGVGPFVEVVDRRWRGNLSCRSPATGIMFLVTATKVFWVKAPTVAATLPVDVSLHAYAGRAGNRATFAAGLGGAFLPGVPIVTPRKLDEVCVPVPSTFAFGRVVTLAHADSVAFVVVVFPENVVKMGRSHLWRLREHAAASLPKDLRELLTRRRSGEFDVSEAQRAG